jgi:hypothetical protein
VCRPRALERAASHYGSADGRFLITMPGEQSAMVPMTVVLNWQAGLKK